jgi:hypothetical protein
MVKVEVKIPKILDQLADSQTYLEATKVGAFEVSNYLRTEHFPEKNANEPNKLGAKRTNFWADVGRSVLQPFVKGFSVIVRINDFRFAQKLYGGVIKAKRVKFLTIPISKQAYDKRVSVFEQETGKRLFRIKSKKGNILLVESLDGEIKPHYLLKQSVDQKPNKNALPSDKKIAEAFTKGANEYIETLKDQE